jgi:hypothetical protein
MACRKYSLTNDSTRSAYYSYQRCSDNVWLYNVRLRSRRSATIYLVENTYTTTEGSIVVVDRGVFPAPAPLTPTPTSSVTTTPTPTSTVGTTPPPTRTQTNTPTNTQTQTPTNTPTNTTTRTSTPQNTPTNTVTPTKTSTPTRTSTPRNTPTNTRTPSNTPTQTNTPSNTRTQTTTPTPTSTVGTTPPPTRTQTVTPTMTATQTVTPTPTSSIPSGRRFYVSSSYTGQTSNGSLNTPWKSLNDVQINMSGFAPSDFILFKNGDTFDGFLTVNKSGSVTAPITFGNYGSGELPTFIGLNGISSLFDLTNVNYITFNGLKIIDITLTGDTSRTQIAKIQKGFSLDRCLFITITNCNISLVGVGINILGGGNCNISNNSIYNLRMIVRTVTEVPPFNDYGAKPLVLDSSSQNTVTRNNFYDNWASSFDYVYDGGCVRLYDSGLGTVGSNNFTYNRFYDSNGAVEIGGIEFGKIKDNLFSYNIFSNNGQLVKIDNSSLNPPTSTNNQFYNNVIVENTVNRNPNLRANMCRFTQSSNYFNTLVFRNNIFQLSSGISLMSPNQWDVGQLTHSNNVFNIFSGGSVNITLNNTEFSATPSTTYWTNTTDVNPALWNYTPTVGSIIINSGVNIPGLTLDFSGNTIPNPPDIGLIQSNTPRPSNTPTMTRTGTPTQTPTNTPTQTQTQTPTNTPTQTNTPTMTGSRPLVTTTPTNTPTRTVTPTVTQSGGANKIYYVSAIGSDTNNGLSEFTPWRTVSGVNNNMSKFMPGDSILFRRGDTFSNTILSVSRSGSPGKPITFGAFGTGAKPIFTFTYSGTSNNIANITSRTYLNFENWNITDLSQPGVSGQTNVARGFALNNSSFINIKSCDFSYVGIGLNAVANNCSMTNCYFTQGRMIRNTPRPINPDDDFGGNPVVIAGSNNIITGNTFTECWAQSFDYGRDGGAIEFFGVSSSRSVNNNIIAYNTFYHTNGFAEFGAEKALSGDSTAYNNKIYYNKIINCGGMYAHWTNPPVGNRFDIKLSGTEFYNNVLVINENDWVGTPIFDTATNYPWPNVMILKNNLFYVSGVTSDTVFDSTLQGVSLQKTNNIYVLAPSITFSVGNTIPVDPSELRTTTNVWRSVTGTADKWDYRLLSGSSAVNFGVDVGIPFDFSGNTVSNPPDAGILEFL